MLLASNGADVRRLFVDVDVDHVHPACVLAGEALQYRCHAARAAPRCPKVDRDELGGGLWVTDIKPTAWVLNEPSLEEAWLPRTRPPIELSSQLSLGE